MALRVLFIGGNGTISRAVSQRVVAAGDDLTLLNRGTSTTRPPIDGVRHLVGDATDPRSVHDAVGTREFDVVVNFRSFLPEQVTADVEFFGPRTGQYVYISSASAYQKPVASLPITESTPLNNPFWQYSRDKIASELVLLDAYRATGFPVTIVRPSHTYDETSIPFDGGWTIVDRMRRGKPILVHGDGTSLWTLTHTRDFAVAFAGLLGHPAAIGDTFHITSDEAMPWNQIATTLGRAAGVEPVLVHETSDAIARALPDWGPWLLGDKSHSVVFDNSKIKRLVPEYAASTPFWRGAQEIVRWYDADPKRRVVNDDLDARLDTIVASLR